MSSIPETQSQALDLHEGAPPADDRGWLIAAGFVAFVLLVAVMLAVYVLVWDGGAHT